MHKVYAYFFLVYSACLMVCSVRTYGILMCAVCGSRQCMPFTKQYMRYLTWCMCFMHVACDFNVQCVFVATTFVQKPPMVTHGNVPVVAFN